MQDYDYISLYLPMNSPCQLSEGSRVLSDECLTWLSNQVGEGVHDERTWMLRHDDPQCRWCYRGLDYTWKGLRTDICRVFYFKSSKDALMFKLAWGGQEA